MLFYIADINVSAMEHIGVWRKIKGQAGALERALGKVCLLLRSGQMLYLVEHGQVLRKCVSPARPNQAEDILEWLREWGVRQTYLRYPYADRWLLRLLEGQRALGIQCVVEFFTFPYDRVLSHGLRKREDALYRGLLSGYVEKCTTFSKDGEIFGIPCIPLANGVDAEVMAWKERAESTGDRLVFLVVSSMRHWHGYDRLLEGLRAYRSQGREDVCIVFAGTGPEEETLRRMAEAYGLGGLVSFCGLQRGEALDRLLDQADLGIGVLGAHRAGISYASPIKAAEYCAHGLPVVMGHEDPRFPLGTPFALRVPNDDSPVDIGQMASFCRRFRDAKARAQIQSHARQYFSWDYIMKPVAEYLGEGRQDGKGRGHLCAVGHRK